ncbi:MAG TPA: ATP-binding cassette domain-containing protein [Candidatus Sulfotelmatobacter sp.]
MTSTLTVQLHKQFGQARDAFSLDLEFHAAPGFTILFGSSGAGKTSILDCVSGLLLPDAGHVAIDDWVLFDTSTSVNVPTAKRQIGYVFQDLALFPHLTVWENIEYGLSHLLRGQRRDRCASILDAFRVSGLGTRKISEVSGGERQRVALARTLVTDPAVLLLDEPLAALDAATKAKIISDLRSWNAAHGIPILYVTHSREEVFALGERVVAIEAGRIVSQGTPHEVLDAPRQETIAQLAGFENIFDATVESTNPDRGTMTCKLFAEGQNSVTFETPLIRAEVGTQLRVGIYAGDILLAIVPPVGLSARNVIEGNIVSLEQRDVVVSARVNCGVEMEVHFTLAARDALQLASGRQVWLVIKTHSCRLMQRQM